MPPITPLKVMAPAALPIELAVDSVITPAYVAAVALEFVNAPAEEMPVPLSVNALVFVNVWPFRSRTAPELTVTELVDAPSAVAEPVLTVPRLIVVPPE